MLKARLLKLGKEGVGEKMDAQQWISLYQAGFFVCLIIAALGLTLAVMLFFRYDIRTIWQIRTGKAKKSGVEALQRASERGGQMRKDRERSYTTEQMFGTRAKTTEDLNCSVTNAPAPAVSAATLLLKGENLSETTQATEFLFVPQETEHPAESCVSEGFGGTVDLSEEKPSIDQEGTPSVKFVITQDTMVIHSNENL